MKENKGIIPLRTILQNCLNHIENLESNRAICDNYEKEFQDLKQFSETVKVNKEYACTEGEKEVNRKKNRYKDILPFNVTRVVLSEYAGIPGSDYINANFIKGASGSPAYIASQGPLPNTVNDFWRMVVECEVQVIVMACNAEEAGKHKCENYWVEKEGEEKRFGMVEICLVKASTVCPDFLVRTMRLKYTNDKAVTEERTVCQFHYSAWPDHGVPPLVRPLLDMVRLVRDTQASETLPVLVHCSAGCGRTGTICAIDFVWGLLRAGKLTEEFSLFNLVRDMRKQRVAMVQTKEQYILVHQAVRELFKEQLRVIESHPYENIDVNGVPLIKDFEEPVYDTIGPWKDDCNEKKDSSEVEKKEAENKEISLHKLNKPDSAPPLPRKKRPNVPSSKQEKEVENQTEKNRCSTIEKEKEIDVSPSNSLLSKPRIAKLKALFERSPTNRPKHRGSQTVSRSHSLGAMRKPLELTENKSQQPIPDGGKLKVPKLSLSTATSTAVSRPVPLIKRSKSLKIASPPPLKISKSKEIKKTETLSRGTMKKSLTARDIFRIPETKSRRRSLESLMGDEPPVITWPTTVGTIPPAERKLTILTSGIGVRERRNSFRQAINKNSQPVVKSPYEQIWLDPKKTVKENTIQVDGYPKNFNGNLTVRNQNGEILKPVSVDQVDGPVPRKETKNNNYERIDIVNPYVLQRAKTQVIKEKYPQRQELTRTFSNAEKNPSKPGDSKNLFLHRLNIEIQEDQNFRERESKKRTEIRSWYANSDLPATRSNPNFLGIHAYGKNKSTVYIKDGGGGESQTTKSEIPPHRLWIPSKPKEESDPHYKTSYDLYATVDSKKMKDRKSQIEIRSKNFSSGSNSLSSHSSGDMSHSDRDSPKVADRFDIDKLEMVRSKTEQLKLANEKRIWISDHLKQEQESESSSSSSARELSSVMNSKPADHVYNYGIVARVKLRQNRTNQTRDDFVLGEPVAPPRVKRHASVMVPRHSMIETSSSQLSAWTSSSNKFIDGSGWNGTLGVDLDAIAASMQKQKGETVGLSEGNHHPKTNSTGSQQPFRKQQHYL